VRNDMVYCVMCVRYMCVCVVGISLKPHDFHKGSGPGLPPPLPLRKELRRLYFVKSVDLPR
jgi:hypothetical protein